MGNSVVTHVVYIVMCIPIQRKVLPYNVTKRRGNVNMDVNADGTERSVMKHAAEDVITVNVTRRASVNMAVYWAIMVRGASSVTQDVMERAIPTADTAPMDARRDTTVGTVAYTVDHV